jgi:hypothetical protein
MGGQSPGPVSRGAVVARTTGHAVLVSFEAVESGVVAPGTVAEVLAGAAPSRR